MMNQKKKSYPVQIVLAAVLLALSHAAVLYGGTEDTIERSFTVKPGGTLKVDTQRGSIEVEGTSRNRLEVKVIREVRNTGRKQAEEIFEKFPVNFEQSGNNVIVTAEYADRNRLRRFWDDLGRKLRVRFIITVPEVYNLDLKTSGGSISTARIEGQIMSRTSGGSLSFDDITGDIRGRTSGGSIKIGQVNGDTEVHTSGGSITIRQARGEVDAHTSGGSITVDEVMGTIQADTSGGSIKATITRQPQGACHLKTSGGSVTVSLAEDIAVDIDARTSGGRVQTDLSVTIQGEVKRSALTAKLNGGGPELILRSSGGSIYLKRK
jgi:DUF4097 and DUF4098 domain-containing protein YvlB